MCHIMVKAVAIEMFAGYLNLWPDFSPNVCVLYQESNERMITFDILQDDGIDAAFFSIVSKS